MSRKINHIIDEIVDQYLWADDSKRPWIIGFSGGKDSTALLQLVWQSLLKAKQLKYSLDREVIVVCNDTMVENPIITEYVFKVLSKIEQAAVEQGLPIRTKKTTPRLEDSFWVNLIGRGYPTPNNAFRWCTERLKIRPTSQYIVDQANKEGAAIILIGTRSSESQSRARSMKKNEVEGKRLSSHPTLNGTYLYAPIRSLMLEEVWFIINTMPSPWGADNSELFQIYSDASADDYECPTVVTDKEHKSCGNSRFGCWVCTVVKKDKSMNSLIENGMDWMKPLLKFRNNLATDRNKPENRMKTRRDGSKAINDMGTYTPDYRAKVLHSLLLTQKSIQEKKPHIELITNQELVAIQVIWFRDLIFNRKVADIYNEVFENRIEMKKHTQKIHKEEELLKGACKDNENDFSLIQDLLTLQKTKTLLIRKRGLQNDIETRIENYISNGK